jgi:hypothetical protein
MFSGESRLLSRGITHSRAWFRGRVPSHERSACCGVNSFQRAGSENDSRTPVYPFPSAIRYH